MEVDDMYTESEPEEMEVEENVSTDSMCIFIRCCGKTSKIGHVFINRRKCCSLFPDYINMSFYSGLLVTLVFDQCVLLLQGCDSVVDTTALVRSCVQSAVSMLRDQVESGFRSTRRIEILLTLLSDNNETKGTNHNFISGLCFCCTCCIS